jgi:hypothetical protein
MMEERVGADSGKKRGVIRRASGVLSSTAVVKGVLSSR